MTLTWTGRSITQLSLHRRRTNIGNMQYGLEHVPFLILHVYNLYWCFQTSGQPYAIALKELEESGFDISRILNPPSEEALTGLAASALSSGVGAATPEKTEEDIQIPPLPNPFLPGILPLLCLLGVICLHILMRLMQVWSTRFLTFVKYTPVANLVDATFVQVVPRAYRGKSVIVPLEQHVLSNGEKSAPFFMFQKHKYVGEVSESGVCFRKLKAPVTEKVETYLKATGLPNETEYNRVLDLYGENEFSIPQPTFLKMYQEQLVEPLTVFQIFSVLLYMLDEYWQYSVFTLVMILMFEGVTVFSRLKNLQTLRGMGNALRNVYVYRYKQWTEVCTSTLVPGDLVSLKRNMEGDNTVPADCLLLQGNAVANEATLTGESVPQMKEAIGQKMSKDDLATALDMKATHKVHLLFGGTTLMQHDGNNSLPSALSIPQTPDKGCLVYVLRTGFSASQGKLVRMIEYSSGKVSGNTWDAVGLASLLVFFALASSGYVLQEGLARKGRVTFELILRCVLIITSVVPAELPMQTAMAVNTALLALVRLSIFCTEPFRISLAGKVNICLFDKTGTITTDQLTAVGVVSNDGTQDDVKDVLPHKPMINSHMNACLVLAGCHSLVEIDGKMIGDPVEEASLKAIDFTYDPKSKQCTPNAKGSERGWDASIDTKGIRVHILHRNHFASKLQRMSVVARVQLKGSSRLRVLVKGSPEAVAKLSKDLPAWFWPTYEDMARRGMRVLALAYRDCEPNVSEQDLAHKPREWAESNLKFSGFAAYQCLVRKDSAEILKQLKDSSHTVGMITGDSTLTAVHVAKEVGIITRPALMLSGSDVLFEWKKSEDDSPVATYQSQSVETLAKTYDLCMDGAALVRADEVNGGVWKHLELIRVFARMTPELKEKVLTSLKACGHYTLMCGDGGNDVGALKQAHVGVALLSGFGSANADKTITGVVAKKKVETTIESLSKDNLMKLHASVLKKKLAAMNVNHEGVTEKSELVELVLAEQNKNIKKLNPFGPLTPEQRKVLQQQQHEEIEADVRERTARGESFARVKALAAFAQRQKDLATQFQNERKAKGGTNFTQWANNAVMQQYMEDFDDGELPMVKLGDASIASPFTSRSPSIKGCVDIIRQGRCALVTTVQMYQILAVNCLISSYSLSVLYLDKVKYANSQMIALGMVSTVASVTLSRATPLPDLSPVRPIASIFHPALFSSLVGQFALHLGVMIYSTALAKEYTLEGDTRHQSHIKPNKFEPNVMSTVIFLVNGVQTISVCAVNYKGRPFMKSMTDNPGLLYSLGVSLVAVFLLCTEAMPLFNKVLEIVPMPDPRFAQILTGILCLDVVGAFFWDQLCLLIFAPKIFFASLQSITARDLKQMVKMFVVALIIIFVVANIDYDEIERQQKLMEEAAKNASQPPAPFVETISS